MVNKDKDGNKILFLQKKEREGDNMAVSVKPAPIFEGETAKRVLKKLEKNRDNTKVFQRCKELAEVFKKD